MYDPKNPMCMLDDLWNLQHTEYDDKGQPLFHDGTIQDFILDAFSGGKWEEYSEENVSHQFTRLSLSKLRYL